MVAQPLDETSGDSTTPPTTPKHGRRWWLIIGGAGLAAILAVALLVWLDERPLRLAESALAAGDVPLAANLVADYLEQHPGHSRALGLRARILVRTNRPVEGIEILERIGAATEDDMQALARAYLLLERWSAALPLLEKIVSLNPENADAWYELTSCRARMWLFQEALDSAQHYARFSGREARGWTLIAGLHRDLRNEEQAVQAFAEALKHDPDATDVQLPAAEFFAQYGLTLLSLGRAAEAVPYLQRSLDQLQVAATCSALAAAYEQLGEHEKAVATYERAVKLDSRSFAARESLANAAIQAGSPQQALEWLEPLQEDPALRSTTAYLLQRVFTLLDQADRAGAWADRAEKLRDQERIESTVNEFVSSAPQSPWGLVIRAYRFAQRGNWPQAQVLMDSIPSDEDARQPFVKDLRRAVRERGSLPRLERIPIK